VTIPTSGYSIFGVEAIIGHTYVSLERDGEEGHQVIFRVIDATESNISLVYEYR
jgi:hypothetical protein